MNVICFHEKFHHSLMFLDKYEARIINNNIQVFFTLQVISMICQLFMIGIYKNIMIDTNHYEHFVSETGAEICTDY
jgi:hypothetical protein